MKRLLNASEVAAKIGKSKDWVHKNIGVNGFPTPYCVTGNVKGWLPSQIELYMKERGIKK